MRIESHRSRFRNKMYTSRWNVASRTTICLGLGTGVGRREGGGVKWKRENYVWWSSREQQETRERDACKITIFPFLLPAIVLLANLSVRQNRSSNEEEAATTPPPSLELESFPSLLLFSQPMKTITLCWFRSCVTIYRFPLDGFFPFLFSFVPHFV